MERSFLFEVVDAVIEVDDQAGIAATWLLQDLFDVRYGGSSGTNFAACLQLAARMRERGECGSIVSLLCDRGERYEQTLFDARWLATHEVHPEPLYGELQRCLRTGQWPAPLLQDVEP